MRLEVTRKSDLAIRALIALAWRGPRLKRAELAEEVGTSKGFMGQVMTPLVKRGWVGSDPGPSGGYLLHADLDGLTVLEVLDEVEGPLDAELCVVADRPCAEVGPCALHHAWSIARKNLTEELAGTTIAATAANLGRMSGRGRMDD